VAGDLAAAVEDISNGAGMASGGGKR
jgi:hypothetical protein